MINDGDFKVEKTVGNGVTFALLRRNGFQVIPFPVIIGNTVVFTVTKKGSTFLTFLRNSTTLIYCLFHRINKFNERG
ncbi:hypothetical protein BTR22_10840 [Alkalihalophilus pseudofirmus]|nr:hypothetical protein BTR22_10840 [Alkalihalophilus pseudofirmus]